MQLKTYSWQTTKFRPSGWILQEQFSWSHANVVTPASATVNLWVEYHDFSMEMELQLIVQRMTGINRQTPTNSPVALFESSGFMIKALTCLRLDIWCEECIPLSSGESLMVPIFEKGVRGNCRLVLWTISFPTVAITPTLEMLTRLTPVFVRNVSGQQGWFSSGPLPKWIWSCKLWCTLTGFLFTFDFLFLYFSRRSNNSFEDRWSYNWNFCPFQSIEPSYLVFFIGKVC